MSKYKIHTADGLDFDVSSEQLEKLDIIENQDGTYHLIFENNSYNIELLESNYLDKSYLLNVNEKEIKLTIKDDLDMAIEKMGFSEKSSVDVGIVLSPMPGLVIQIKHKIGAEVQKGDLLLVLEAMKMENIIKSPSTGVIKNILVSEGDTVTKKQVLIELE